MSGTGMYTYQYCSISANKMQGVFVKKQKISDSVKQKSDTVLYMPLFSVHTTAEPLRKGVGLDVLS